MDAMMTVFGEAFNEVDTYTGARPRRGSGCLTFRVHLNAPGSIFVH
jgi:hypothetical protein